MASINATVSFLEGTLSLIHIPLDLYSVFLQPILKVLLPPSQGDTESAIALPADVRRHRHGFLNISVTPIECSIVCNSAWAESIFKPVIKRLSAEQAKTVAISEDTYAVLSVLTAGLDAGSRVADLTSPLALAGIPLFFITTYYCDFILVPTKDRQGVIKTLLAKGFVFSDDDDQSRLISPSSSRRPSTTYSYPPANRPKHSYGPGNGYNYHSRTTSQSSDPSSLDVVNTPPSPSTTTSTNPDDNISSLQTRTFTLLKKRHVTPHVIPNLTLVQCTGLRGAGFLSTPPNTRSSRTSHHRHSTSSTPIETYWIDTIDTKLYTAVISALATQPNFLSLTLAHEDPPSLLLDRELLGLFGDALIGPTINRGSVAEKKEKGLLVPVFLDLADLPFEATGIVSGVAGRLVREMERMGGGEGGEKVEGAGAVVELSYLSTARAGAVVLERGQAEAALGVLRGLLEGEMDGTGVAE